jgi:hypothetical protein
LFVGVAGAEEIGRDGQNLGEEVSSQLLIVKGHRDLGEHRDYAAELCTSCAVSEIIGAQYAQNAGHGNLTDL